MLGSSDNKMTDGDTYIMSVDDFGLPHVTELWSSGFITPGPSNAPADSISNISGHKNFTHSSVTFSRKLIGASSNQVSIENKLFSVSFAYSNDNTADLKYHGRVNRFSSFINFYGVIKDKTFAIAVHAACMLVGWGLFVPVSMFFTFRAKIKEDEAYAGYLNIKHNKWAAIIHISLKTGTLILTIAGIVTLAVSGSLKMNSPHGVLGIIIVILTGIMATLGPLPLDSINFIRSLIHKYLGKFIHTYIYIYTYIYMYKCIISFFAQGMLLYGLR
jgi:hypothetical protein